MRYAHGLLLLGLMAHVVVAAEPRVVEVPRGDPAKWVEIKAPKGRILRLSAEPASKWLLIDEDLGADLLSAEGGKIADFASATDGRFKVIVTGPDGTPSRLVVVVGGAPIPPKPDALVEKLRAAVDADQSPDRAEKVKLLAAQYGEFAKQARDTGNATPKQLIALCRGTTVELIGTALVGVRQALADELAAILPIIDAPFTDAQREATAALFERFSTILKDLSNGK